MNDAVVDALVSQLARSAGLQRHRQLKPSAKLAVQLLMRLAGLFLVWIPAMKRKTRLADGSEWNFWPIDNSSNPSYKSYVRSLSKLSSDQLSSMRLDKHILSDDYEDAAMVVRAIAASDLSKVLLSKAGRAKYLKWIEDNDYDDNEESGDSDDGPVGM